MANIKDSGSNYRFFEGVPKASVPRSAFDLSYLNTLTCKQGQCVPVYKQKTLMNEDYGISVDVLINVVNPPVVPLMSRQRAFLHYYWLSFHQLWKSAQIFFDKGRTKSSYTEASALRIPTITLSKWERGSLADMLGYNFVSNAYSSYKCCALDFMAYIRIWRDMYCNQRIFAKYLEDSANGGNQVDKLILDFMFPNDDADFRIGSVQWNALVENQHAVDKLFGSLWWRNWTDDYFTSAQLSPVYTDDVPEIPLSLSKDKPFGVAESLSGPLGSGGVLKFDSNGKSYFGSVDGSASTTDKFVEILNNTVNFRDSAISGLTIDAIRACESATLILEKMSKTDGSYGQFAKVMFGESPKSAFDFRPTYIGGTYQPIVYSQVLNTSGGATPQGTISGRGISSGAGSIGHFHSDDYGIILGILSIMPDTYYCQGLQREDTYETAEEFYLPDRAQLGMQAIMQQEIYNTDDPVENKKVLAYINRFDELRYRANEVHGWLADKNKGDFFPYIQTRYFESAPTLSPSFLTTEDNIPNDWLSYPDAPPFIVQIANKVRAVRPLPYRAEPATFGM